MPLGFASLSLDAARNLEFTLSYLLEWDCENLSYYDLLLKCNVSNELVSKLRENIVFSLDSAAK